MTSKHPVIIVTGASGSGKSTALAAFEDAGFYCVDNLPLLLTRHFMERYAVEDSSRPGWAFGMDLRDKDFITHYRTVFTALATAGHPPKVVFLDAEERILLRRYHQTRRHHPLDQGGSLLAAIQAEKQELADLKVAADHSIDTTHLSIHELKFKILGIAQQYADIAEMRVNIVSFGFKYGIPLEADLLVDVRFLANPYFVPELKSKDGEAPAVFAFVMQDPQTRPFIEKYLNLLDYLIPLYRKEGKAYLTIAVGCTGGRHRSVVIARQVHKHIKQICSAAKLIHRDIRNSV